MSTLFSHFFNKINQISPLETNFTEVLSAIALTPKLLYFYGKMPKNVAKNGKSARTGVKSARPKTVAIVGSRHNTRYGEEVAYRLAYELGKRGVVVVSGLAYGIDSIAHRGCLDAGGVTVAVLGTRIDDIYPKTHLKLAQEILEKDGAIISEYASLTDKTAPLGPAEAGSRDGEWVSYEKELAGEDKPPYDKRRLEQKFSFLYRNRIIAGLADAVVVVEAAEKSGSLNTATHALEQGKDVFAVPGNITAPYSQGCNKLLRQGALVYTEPDDVLRELFPEDFLRKTREQKRLRLFGDTDVETLILQAIGKGLRTSEEIMDATHLPIEVFNQTVTLLEIKGRVLGLGMGNWGLC